MPRKPRFYLPGVPAHIVQRGNDRQPVFFAEADYTAYLEWLFEGAKRYGCDIPAFVLMTNHVHLVMTPLRSDSISRTIQHVGRKYVMFVNRRYRRTGTLWEGRHKGMLINSAEYALVCYRYIELNPVRAGMVDTLAKYGWSSFRENALGENRYPLTPSPQYSVLGADEQERQRSYVALFKSHLDEETTSNFRHCTQTGMPLGNDRFRDQISAVLGRSVGQATRGRLAKQ